MFFSKIPEYKLNTFLRGDSNEKKEVSNKQLKTKVCLKLQRSFGDCAACCWISAS